jgi:hypothetical protein
MATEQRVIVCTGPPGNGRDDILNEMRENTTFNYYHLFEYIVEEARLDDTNLTKLNILDFYDSSPERMEGYHKTAIHKITQEIGKRPGTHIVSTPLHFEWKGNRFQGLRPRTRHDSHHIRRHSQGPRPPKPRHPMARTHIHPRRDRQLAPRRDQTSIRPRRSIHPPPRDPTRRLRGHGREKVYLSHPITGESETMLSDIYEFGNTLSEYYVVFDPYMIKDWNTVEAWRRVVNAAIEAGEPRPTKLNFTMEYKSGDIHEEIDANELEAGIKNLRFQIIDTDYKLIENSAMVVVYHPRAAISAGVMCEMVYAKALAKMVYAYYPYEPSPFFEWYATRIFTEEDELRDFLIKESKVTGQTPLDIYSGQPRE